MKFSVVVIFGFLLSASACKDGAEKLCPELNIDLLEFHVEEVKEVLDVWLSELQPTPTVEDLIGHQENVSIFIDRLRNNCGLEVQLGCYACIETYPVQSEAIVFVRDGGQTHKRVLDISTPETGTMSVVNIHE